jgi:uncharacterized protein YdhG (YjbR/CyaY superfamily)
MSGADAVDAYLAKLPADERDALERLRAQIRSLVPDSEESITYGMPTVKVKGKALLLYAAWKEHLSLYGLSGEFVAAHADQLAGFGGTRGSVHFTPERPFPEPLIEEMVRSRLAELAAGR